MNNNLSRVLPLALLLVAASTAAPAAGDEPSEKKKEKTIVITDDGVLSDGDEPFVWRFPEHGRQGRIGVRLLDMTPELRAHYGAPREAGVLVAGVEKESPASKAGVQVGDIVTRAGGERIESAADLSRAVRHAKAGETLMLEVSRDRSLKQLTVKVEERRPSEIDLGDLGRDLGRDIGREIGRHAWVFRDSPVIRDRRVIRDLPEFRDRLQERLDELEKRLRDLEKKIPAR
jgi:membrane-associated protease RseP (regulator of RpoE activity)